MQCWNQKIMHLLGFTKLKMLKYKLKMNINALYLSKYLILLHKMTPGIHLNIN